MVWNLSLPASLFGTLKRDMASMYYNCSTPVTIPRHCVLPTLRYLTPSSPVPFFCPHHSFSNRTVCNVVPPIGRQCPLGDTGIATKTTSPAQLHKLRIRDSLPVPMTAAINEGPTFDAGAVLGVGFHTLQNIYYPTLRTVIN